jgi:hypothetical protein
LKDGTLAAAKIEVGERHRRDSDWHTEDQLKEIDLESARDAITLNRMGEGPRYRGMIDVPGQPGYRAQVMSLLRASPVSEWHKVINANTLTKLKNFDQKLKDHGLVGNEPEFEIDSVTGEPTFFDCEFTPAAETTRKNQSQLLTFFPSLATRMRPEETIKFLVHLKESTEPADGPVLNSILSLINFRIRHPGESEIESAMRNLRRDLTARGFVMPPESPNY